MSILRPSCYNRTTRHIGGDGIDTPRWILWDWNGTLYDDVAVCIAAMNGMRAERGIAPPLDADSYRRIFGFPVSAYYLRAGLRFEEESFEALAAIFMARYHAASAQCGLHEGAASALRGLQARGIRQVLLSASKTEHLARQLEPFGVASCFDSILGLDDFYANSKLTIAENWARAHRVDARDVLCIGDTTHDFEVAQALGCACLLVASGHQSREVLSRCGCPVVTDLRAAAAWLG